MIILNETMIHSRLVEEVPDTTSQAVRIPPLASILMAGDKT